MAAATEGDPQKAKALLKSEPGLVSSKDDKYRRTPLIWAAAYGPPDSPNVMHNSVIGGSRIAEWLLLTDCLFLLSHLVPENERAAVSRNRNV